MGRHAHLRASYCFPLSKSVPVDVNSCLLWLRGIDLNGFEVLLNFVNFFQTNDDQVRHRQHPRSGWAQS